MALDLDAFAAWHAIAARPDVFSPVRADAGTFARKIVTKLIKAKATGLPEIRAIHDALGVETFGLIVDGMTDKELGALATRLDKHHPEMKSGTARWRRAHVMQLARADAEPAPKPAKRASTRKPPSEGKESSKKPVRKAREASGTGYVSAGVTRKPSQNT